MAEKKKFGVWKIILIVIGVSLLISVFSNLGNDSEPADTTAAKEEPAAEVVAPEPVKELTEAEKAELAAQERKDMIGEAFSAWDGSHVALAAFIKKNMNNPKSYDHVETLYRDDGDYITVQTTFRGTNKFNAIVSNTVKARCSVSGQVLEIISQD